MLWRRRYYHRFTLAELEIRREKRALIVQRALRLFAIVLALCLTMLLSLVCFKPWKDLRSLEHERSFLQAHLEKSREQMEQAKNEFIWISQDPHYFEMIARRAHSPHCGTQAPEIKRFSAGKENHARGSSPSPVVGGSQTLACRTKYGINLTQPYSGCLSGSVLSYSFINLADQLILSGKRHAGVVVRYVPSFLARESASWCLEKYKSLCSWGSSATL